MTTSGDGPTDTPNVVAMRGLPRTLPKSAVSTASNIKHLKSFLRDDLQTIYENTMVARGHLAVMLDNAPTTQQKNTTTKLMDLNHAMDAIISISQQCLTDWTDTAG